MYAAACFRHRLSCIDPLELRVYFSIYRILNFYDVWEYCSVHHMTSYQLSIDFEPPLLPDCDDGTNSLFFHNDLPYGTEVEYFFEFLV